MSRHPATGLRAARPAATSWFLLTLTALAAFLGSGLELGRLPDPSTRLVASADGRGSDAPTGSTERRTDARVPFVGAVLGAAPSPAGAPAELATSGGTVLVGAPTRLVALSEDAPQWAGSDVVRRSGRAPPV